MKIVILVIVVLAVAGVLGYKFLGDKTPATNINAVVTTNSTAAPATKTQVATESQKVFYLFHNPKDQDAECRTIYAFADDVERDLPGRVKVLRPDVKAETALVEKYKVKVLPTILITSPDGTEQERFEGEGEKITAGVKNAVAKLKESK